MITCSKLILYRSGEEEAQSKSQDQKSYAIPLPILLKKDGHKSLTNHEIQSENVAHSQGQLRLSRYILLNFVQSCTKGSIDIINCNFHDIY